MRDGDQGCIGDNPRILAGEDVGLVEREISGIKIITKGQTQLARVKRAIIQTIVVKKREEVMDDLREAGDRARDRPGGYAEAPNFIFMETMMMIELTQFQNQSQIVQSSGTSWMVMNKKLCSV